MRNNEVYSQSLNGKDDLESKTGITDPWSLSLSATHMNFAIPKTGNFLSSSINIGYAMKRISFWVDRYLCNGREWKSISLLWSFSLTTFSEMEFQEQGI